MRDRLDSSKSFIMSTFKCSPKDILIYNIAEFYEDETESFDRRVCTGVVREGMGVVPVTANEFAEINRNAEMVMSKCKNMINVLSDSIDEFSENMVKFKKMKNEVSVRNCSN